MFYDLSKVARHHQNNLAASAPPSLIPKRCTCGASITARQLNQHGKCEHCRLTAGLQDGDLDKLRFMLGATANCSGKPGSRNHYLCSVQDHAAMERLVAAGLARVGAPLLTSLYYHATKDGCRAVGLDPAGIARAMNAAPYVFEPIDAGARIASQVAVWRKEVVRLNGLIAAAIGAPVAEDAQETIAVMPHPCPHCEGGKVKSTLTLMEQPCHICGGCGLIRRSIVPTDFIRNKAKP